MTRATASDGDFDYVVVGSGAGGGTVAARLAEGGMQGAACSRPAAIRAQLTGGARGMGDGNRLPDDYDVPAFHPFASENEALRWDFYVRHYADEARQARDPKYRSCDGADGVLYPRAGTLGGCTAHNAMILVCPHDDRTGTGSRELTGDASWSAANMQRLLPPARALPPPAAPAGAATTSASTGPATAGTAGCRPRRRCPRGAFRDGELMRTIVLSAEAALEESGRPLRARLRWFLRSAGDPNDRDVRRGRCRGLRYTPLTTRERPPHRHARAAARGGRAPSRPAVHRARRAGDPGAARRRDRAVGVEYLKGARLYRAHAPEPDAAAGEPRKARARREVILAGGAFNTPQLLMLSGIGPRGAGAPRHRRRGSTCPGVGRNLQDRYEVGVVNRMALRPWEALAEARFEAGDPLYQAWAEGRDSLYATNGAGLAVITRSDARPRRCPTCSAWRCSARFEGYYPGYAAELAGTSTT